MGHILVVDDEELVRRMLATALQRAGHWVSEAGDGAQALDLLERSVRGHDEFDFAASARTFVIAVEDYGETVILPRFVDWLGQVAPHIQIRIRPERGHQLTEELREGSVDLSLDYFAQREPNFHSQCVLTESLLTLSRVDHPQAKDRMSLESYLALRHVVLTPRAGAMPMTVYSRPVMVNDRPMMPGSAPNRPRQIPSPRTATGAAPS